MCLSLGHRVAVLVVSHCCCASALLGDAFLLCWLHDPVVACNLAPCLFHEQNLIHFVDEFIVWIVDLGCIRGCVLVVYLLVEKQSDGRQ